MNWRMLGREGLACSCKACWLRTGSVSSMSEKPLQTLLTREIRVVTSRFTRSTSVHQISTDNYNYNIVYQCLPSVLCCWLGYGNLRRARGPKTHGIATTVSGLGQWGWKLFLSEGQRSEYLSAVQNFGFLILKWHVLVDSEAKVGAMALLAPQFLATRSGIARSTDYPMGNTTCLILQKLKYEEFRPVPWECSGWEQLLKMAIRTLNVWYITDSSDALYTLVVRLRLVFSTFEMCPCHTPGHKEPQTEFQIVQCSGQYLMLLTN